MLGALAGSAHVLIRADVAGFRRDMAASERDFLASTGRMSRDAATAGQRIRRGLTLGAGLAGAIAPVYLLQRALRATWTELQEGQRIAAQTEAVLTSTGGAAGLTARDVEALASAWQRIAGVDDAVVQHGANVLLTFRNIRNELGEGNDVFAQAIETLLDMGFTFDRLGAGASGALDSLQADAIRLGKALNDPVRGMSALRRVGVAFTRDQEALVERLVATGDVLGAQKVLLAELRAEFGGSARAAGETFPQALERARNTAADAAATYLEALVPALEKGADWLQRQIDAFADNEEAQREFRETVEEVAKTIGDAVELADDFADAIGGWENVIKTVIALKLAGWIMGLVGPMRTARREAYLTAGAFAAMGAASSFPTWGRGLPLPGPRGLGRLGLPAIGLAGSVAIGTGVAVASTPGAGGARQDVGDFPFLLALVERAGRGGVLSEREQAILAMLDPKRSLAQQRPDVLRRAEARARKLASGTRAGAGEDVSRGPGGARAPRSPARPPAPFVPRTELSIGTRQALAEAERTETEVDDLRALERAERELSRMLRQRGLTAEERLALTQDLADVEQRIRSIEEARRSQAERAADERRRDRQELADRRREALRAAHERRVDALERKVARAQETQWLGDDLKTLERLRAYYVQYRDTFKRGSAEWLAANDDVRDVESRLAGVRSERASRRDELRLWRLERKVRLAEETEGVQDDIRALSRLRAYWIAQRREAARYGEAWRAAQDEIDSISATIRDARRQGRGRERQTDALELVNEFLRLQADYGPNFFGDGAFRFPSVETSSAQAAKQAVTIVQEFPQAPTDYFREARYAQAAAAAVFDG